MPAKRKYNVKGTKDFIVLAGIFFFLCLWAVKDAWYPSPKVLGKHPREVSASFETAGAIMQLNVAEGDAIGEGQILAELRCTNIEAELDIAKKAYTAAKDEHVLVDKALREAVKNGTSSEGIAEFEQGRADARIAMDAALEKVGAMREKLDAAKLVSSHKGVVKDIPVLLHDRVEAGQTIVVIDPKDHFYLFNKSLAIFSFIAFWVFLGIHVLAQ